MYSNINDIGEVTSDTQSATLTSGSSIKVCTLSLSEGTYILYAQGKIQSNSSGRRILNILNGSFYNSAMLAQETINAVSIGDSYINVSAIYSTDTQSTITSWMLQNSGSELTGEVVLKAIKIK